MPTQTNSFETTAGDTRQVKQAPRLSHRGLTIMLIVMCLIPIITLTVMWQVLPAVKQNALQAHVSAVGLPPAKYYLTKYYERPPYEGGELVVTNVGDQEWNYLNIRINDGQYQIYDVPPVPAGKTGQYQLDQFLTRSGQNFNLQYNQLKNVRIFAGLPTRDRATFYQDFETVPEP